MVLKNEDYFDFLNEVRKIHNAGEKTWRELCELFKTTFKEEISEDALRRRVKRAGKGTPFPNYSNKSFKNEETGPTEFTEYSADGTIEASKIVNDIKAFNGDKAKVLSLLGYSADEWELLKVRTSVWDGGADGKPKYSVKYKVRPITEVPVTDFIQAAVEAVKRNIKPLNLPRKEHEFTHNTKKLMEIPPIELHLGKIGSKATTGEDYNVEIAKKRFYDIFEKIYEKQRQENCEACLLVIGSDFFNSESDNATSTHKIPQQNCAHYIDLFTEGVKMYHNVITRLREKFNTVNVMLCAGNHARAMEFFLYVALQQAYLKDKYVKFVNNYQETQVFEYGENAIFYNHGDVDIKRVIQSIPAEFANVWGKHTFRELHLGHLHKETVVDDESGMITRRVGSPCGTDIWHKLNRYVGATKKHQVFVWDIQCGLINIFYIPTR